MNTKHVPLLILTALGAIGVLSSCSKDEVEDTHSDLVGAPHANTVVAFTMSYTRAGAPFDKSVQFTDGAGTPVLVTRLKFFLAQPSFVDDAGDSVAAFPAKHFLVDLDDGGLVRNIGELDGHLHEMTIGVGLDSTTNHTDPTISVEPMASSGLWWGWAGGYKFLVLEGRYDSDGDGLVEGTDFPFEFHCGMDTAYRRIMLNVHTDADMGGNVILPLDLNIDSLFSGLDVATQPVVHVVNDISLGLMQRLGNGLTHVE
ncbi:MAG: MbnP family protein [Flavobacteriales bacterium]